MLVAQGPTRGPSAGLNAGLLGGRILLVVLCVWAAVGCSGPDVTITILSPENGATVPAYEDITLQIAIEGGYLSGQTGEGREGHLHLFVDRQLVAMVDDMNPTINLIPGGHLITVEFSGPAHESLGFSTQIELTAR